MKQKHAAHYWYAVILLLLAFAWVLSLKPASAASCSSYPFTLQNNTTADATQVMSNFNTVRNCVINNAAGSGVNTDITSMTGLSTPLSVPQGGTPVFIGGTSTGSANVQVVATTSPIGFALTNGYRVTFIAGFTNTGPATLNVNSTGATAVKKPGFGGLEALVYGEMVAGNVVEAVYDGTEFVLLSVLVPPFGAAQSVTASSTTDIGIFNTHNVVINGTTSITAFGVTASTNQPVYNLKFGGALTLTYNATSLIIPGAGNITTAANDTAVVEFLGSGNWRVNSYTRASGAGIVAVTPLCGANGFATVNTAAAPTTSVDYSAASAVMVNSSNVTITATSVSGTINALTTGADGLDTGSLANTTWYYGYLINNGTLTKGLLSASSTSPTMPSGYTYKCRLFAEITDGSAHFLGVKQKGRRAQYTLGSLLSLLPTISQGVVGTFGTTGTTYASTSVSAYVPATAIEIGLLLSNRYNNNAIANVVVAPNTSYDGPQTQKPPFLWPGGTSPATLSGWMVLESTNIAISSDGNGAVVQAIGWVDNVNAN